MRYKYPRTYHLPWSQTISADDKFLDALDHFHGEEVVVTEKLDGENTTLYKDWSHARSIDSPANISRDWVRRLHSMIRHDIPEGMRICGENVWAEHSIRYEDGRLNSYFYLFSIWDHQTCLSYDETVEWANIFDLPMPQVFYRGCFDEYNLTQLAESLDLNKIEGYVIRKTSSFSYNEFDKSVAKFVRANHVTTNQHWLKHIKKNGELSKPIKPVFMDI